MGLCLMFKEYVSLLLGAERIRFFLLLALVYASKDFICRIEIYVLITVLWLGKYGTGQLVFAQMDFLESQMANV